MQDWDRGTIVGRRTFGKGLVQKQYDLSGGAALRLTVARYYTPTGRSIQKPYSNGREAYNDEVLERFHNGEVIHPDTIKIAEGLAFKTKGEEKVYGGGGITPDVFVPYDTTDFSEDMSALFAQQHFAKFIYQYYISDKAYFDQFKDARDFSKRFNTNEKSWGALMKYVAENKINLPSLPARDQIELKKRIKTWMARQIWGMPGYYEVSNEY